MRTSGNNKARAGGLAAFNVHLEELRRRLIWVLAVFAVVFGGVFCLPRFDESVALLVLKALRQAFLPPGNSLVFLSPLEPVFAALNLSFCLGLAAALPVFHYHLYRFVAPALQAKGRRVLGGILGGSLVLFAAGASLAYFLFIPISFKILLKYGEFAAAMPAVTILQFSKFVLLALLVFGLPFELPLLMGLAVVLGLVQARVFREKRRVFYAALALFSAVVTPDPTPVSMIILTVILWGLYEIGIWICGALASASGNPKVKAAGVK